MTENARLRRREKALLRRIYLQTVPDAIRAAEKGNTKALCEFFRAWMPEPEGELLADFIDRNLTIGSPGRRQGQHVDNSPTAEMERTIIAIVKWQRSNWRTQSGGKPLPRGLQEKWINDICDQMAENGDLHGLGEIRVENIRAALKRGEKRSRK